MTFTETEHPRTSQGMFADKMQSAPEASLSAATAADLEDDASWAGVGPRAAEERYYNAAAADFVHRFNRTGRGYRLTKMMTLPSTDQVGPQTLRATFTRDSYAHDSSATVELWTPTGWAEVVRTTGYDFPAAPGGESKDDDACQSFADEYLQDRCIEAIRVIG